MKNLQVRKDELHAEIIKMMLDGLPLPEGAGKNFEKALPSISEGLKNKDKSLTDKEHKWILITTYRYDSVENKVFASGFKENGIREVIESRTC